MHFSNYHFRSFSHTLHATPLSVKLWRRASVWDLGPVGPWFKSLPFHGSDKQSVGHGWGLVDRIISVINTLTMLVICP